MACHVQTSVSDGGCRDRKRWILSVPVKGELWLDSGAVSAVKDQKKSLFAAGILKVTGGFAAQDALVLCDASGYEFARGLCNYSQQEVLVVQVGTPVPSPHPFCSRLSVKRYYHHTYQVYVLIYMISCTVVYICHSSDGYWGPETIYCF